MKQLRGRDLDIRRDRWTSPSGKTWIRLCPGRYRTFGEGENALQEGNRRHDRPETGSDASPPAETAMGSHLRD